MRRAEFREERDRAPDMRQRRIVLSLGRRDPSEPNFDGRSRRRFVDERKKQPLALVEVARFEQRLRELDPGG